MQLVKNEVSNFHKKREISFTWQINTNDLTIDASALQELGITHEISSIEHFLALFSASDKTLISEMLVQVKRGSNPEPIRACIITKTSSINLALVSAKKITENLLAGVVIPMFSSPNKEDLSSFFHQIFENNHHGMVVTDKHTRIVACNRYFEKSTGYKLEDILGKKTSIFNAGKHGSLFFRDMWEKIAKNGSWSGLILSKSKSGSTKPQELLIQKLVSMKGSIYYLGITLDLSSKLYRVAGIEHGGIELLTQLPNEEEFFTKIQDERSELKDNEGMLILSFVPKFDEASEFDQRKQLASALAYHESDCTAGFIKKSVFTLAIIYQHNKSKPHSLSIFEAIRERFNKIKARVDKDVYRQSMNSTIGVSVLGLDANNEHRMLSHSLQAMYEKHTSNNNNICFFNRNLHEKVKRREVLEEIVSRSVKDKSMQVFFQPIISSKRLKICKLEALCRFQDDNGEYLNTQEMILIAEDMALVSELDLAVADKAMEQREQLIQLYGNDVEITFNVSLNTSKPMKSLFKDLMSLFKTHRKHLPYVTIELTESAYFNSEKKDSNLLFDLRKKGVKVAIDDFGTGYSSFSYLKDGNFDVLKIDRDFVMNLIVGSHNYYIVKMITHLAHTLNVEVVAEGVESIQEVNILRDLKVDYLQGFYFEKPLPIQLLSSDINDREEIRDLSNLKIQDVELFTYPPTLSPAHTLREVKTLFDDNSIYTLPVIIDRKCVGVITREIYNLHTTPTLGTDQETMKEYRSLDKVASAMMTSSITRVHKTINAGEIHEKIRNHNPLPWVVIDDYENYIGIIDSFSIIHYLNNQ